MKSRGKKADVGPTGGEVTVEIAINTGRRVQGWRSGCRIGDKTVKIEGTLAQSLKVFGRGFLSGASGCVVDDEEMKLGEQVTKKMDKE